VSLRTNIKLYSFNESIIALTPTTLTKQSIMALTPTTRTTSNTHDTYHLSTRTPARLAPPASVTVAAGG